MVKDTFFFKLCEQPIKAPCSLPIFYYNKKSKDLLDLSFEIEMLTNLLNKKKEYLSNLLLMPKNKSKSEMNLEKNDMDSFDTYYRIYFPKDCKIDFNLYVCPDEVKVTSKKDKVTVISSVIAAFATVMTKKTITDIVNVITQENIDKIKKIFTNYSI